MQLNLKPNDNFNERLNQMKVLLAESGKNGKLKYVEDKLGKVSALHSFILSVSFRFIPFHSVFYSNPPISNENFI